MEMLATEFGRVPGPEIVISLMRLVGAALLCGLIGLEREFRDHAAGLRTNMLVGLACATFALVALGLLDTYDDDHIRMDPLRLIEAVTGGVAFLAAGLIVLTRGRVRGLTTGASVWLSAAVGLSAGLGHWLVAVAAAVAGVLVLTAVRQLEIRWGIAGQRSLEEPYEP